MVRRGSTTKRNSKDNMRPHLVNTRPREEVHPTTSKTVSESGVVINSKECEPSVKVIESHGNINKKDNEEDLNPPKVPSKRLNSTVSLDLKPQVKLSASHSDTSLAKHMRPLSAGNLSWFKPIITGSLEFSKTSLSMPNHLKEQSKPKDEKNTGSGNALSKSKGIPKGNSNG